MSNPEECEQDDGMLDRYDFSQAVRGKYVDRFPKDVVMVTLDPEVARVFPDANSVNEALRLLIKVARAAKPASSEPEAA